MKLFACFHFLNAKYCLKGKWENYGLRKVIQDKSHHKAPRLIIARTKWKYLSRSSMIPLKSCWAGTWGSHTLPRGRGARRLQSWSLHKFPTVQEARTDQTQSEPSLLSPQGPAGDPVSKRRTAMGLEKRSKLALNAASANSVHRNVYYLLDAFSHELYKVPSGQEFGG